MDTTAENKTSGIEKVWLSDKHFTDICDYFHAGDVLVLNNTKVIPARAFAHKKGLTPNEENSVEILFVQYQGGSTWKAMISKPVAAIRLLSRSLKVTSLAAHSVAAEVDCDGRNQITSIRDILQH